MKTFGVNLTEQAKSGRFTSITGRDEEIEQITSVSPGQEAHLSTYQGSHGLPISLAGGTLWLHHPSLQGPERRCSCRLGIRCIDLGECRPVN